MHVAIAIALTASFVNIAPDPVQAPGALNLDHYFKGYDACFVLLNLDTGETTRYKPERCARRFSPCSTFKIPNAIIGLETGVLTGPDHKMEWDGTRHQRAACNRNHTLQTAIRDSVVWYFQRVASGIGAERMQKWLDDADYGNRDMSGGLTQFWLGDSLEISADEQVAFLKKLHTETLPVSKRAQQLAKEILILEKSRDCTLRGKTGSRADDTYKRAILGWFVGSVETPDATFVFACNLSAYDHASGAKAREISKTVLRSLKILPAKPAIPARTSDASR